MNKIKQRHRYAAFTVLCSGMHRPFEMFWRDGDLTEEHLNGLTEEQQDKIKSLSILAQDIANADPSNSDILDSTS